MLGTYTISVWAEAVPALEYENIDLAYEKIDEVFSTTSFNSVYTLSLDSSNAQTKGTETLYLKYGDDIYMDQDLETPLESGGKTNFIVPTGWQDEPPTVTITFDSGEHGKFQEIIPMLGMVLESQTSSMEVTGVGYTFSGYYLESTHLTQLIDAEGYKTSLFTSSLVNHDAKLYAGKRISVIGGTVTVPSGLVTTDENYVFGGWGTSDKVKVIDANETSHTFTDKDAYIPDGDVTLYAIWTEAV